MTNLQFKAAQDLATASLRQYLPERPDDAWLIAVVDPPRFGWDWPALGQGFFEPLRAWADAHDARLRPVLAGLLIDALGGEKERHTDLLAALELIYLASIMLDDLRNGRDLSASTSPAVDVPLPVWVTVAYNARQLAPVLIMRRATSLPGPARVKLVHRFMLQQGLGSVLDLWGSEQGLVHASLEDYLSHLTNYVGAPGLGLACAFAAAAAGLDDPAADQLTRAGTELGVALRLAAQVEGRTRSISVAGHAEAEQLIRWRRAFPMEQLAAAADRLRGSAFARAAQVLPAAGAVFSDFFNALQAPEPGEKLS